MRPRVCRAESNLQTQARVGAPPGSSAIFRHFADLGMCVHLSFIQKVSNLQNNCAVSWGVPALRSRGLLVMPAPQ